MKVLALAGGVGGAKLLVGLQRVVGRDVTAVVNVGDDATIYGVHVSPDIDIVTYWLAGIADVRRGWGVAGDSFAAMAQLERLGEDAWFRLGDADLATCLYRTRRLGEGAPLSRITDEVGRSLGVAARVLPATDDRLRTVLTTADGRRLEFQEYFVRERTEPDIAQVAYEGIERAAPAPGVLDAIAEADVVVVCPSNPVLSVHPTLLPATRAALTAHPRVVAVSPIVRGSALKGPADRLLTSLGLGSSASAVASLYREWCDRYVVDRTDAEEADKVEALGLEASILDTIMRDHEASARLARELLS